MQEARIYHEKSLYENFVLDSYKRRLISFITENRKRRAEFRRSFAHFESYFDEKYLTRVPYELLTCMNIAGRLGSQSNVVHVFSEIEKYDGVEFPLMEVLNNLLMSGHGFLLSIVPGRLAFYQGENIANAFILARSMPDAIIDFSDSIT